jgi:hypothetical protein
MRLLERSRVAAARLQEAEDVRAAYEACRNRRRAAYLSMLRTGGPEKDLRAARGRLAAADLQLAEARRLALDAWARYE